MSRSLILFFSVIFSMTGHAVRAGVGDGHRILFIKGGPGSGGFLEGGADEQLSSIHDRSTNNRNHGWGELGDILRDEGFILEQLVEGTRGTIPINLAGLTLADYSVIVFGSNNAAYGTEHVDTLEAYVRGGGSALFISDANWGLNWGDAPSSDQHFLDRFGWEMNQDAGHYTLTTAEYAEPDHPVLAGVSSFEGEGVSPITIVDYNVPGVSSTRLAGAKGNVRRNTRFDSGPRTASTVHDCSLVVATVDAGKIAGHFDRNTFFNRNGAGTDIHDNDNDELAVNLFAWLVSDATPLPRLKRGNVNGDMSVNVSDASFILNYLFLGEADIRCLDAADVNDTGNIDLADPVIILNYLFLGGPAPEDPFLDCGFDTTTDVFELGCDSFPACEEL